MREIDRNAIKAKLNEEYLEIFMVEHEGFIINRASKTIGRFISKSDDQWSISISAFLEAIRGYSFEKGAFLPFAENVIKKRLYDYIRKESKHYNEIPVDYTMIENSTEETSIYNSEIVKKLTVVDYIDSKLEIESIILIIKEYGFDFLDLSLVSPKALKTKEACAKAIAYLHKNPVMFNEMRRTKNLPIKIIEKNCGVPRKILERHRKYLIAGAEIMHGDFPILSEYLRYVRRELSK